MPEEPTIDERLRVAAWLEGQAKQAQARLDAMPTIFVPSHLGLSEDLRKSMTADMTASLLIARKLRCLAEIQTTERTDLAAEGEQSDLRCSERLPVGVDLPAGPRAP